MTDVVSRHRTECIGCAKSYPARSPRTSPIGNGRDGDRGGGLDDDQGRPARI